MSLEPANLESATKRYAAVASIAAVMLLSGCATGPDPHLYDDLEKFESGLSFHSVGGVSCETNFGSWGIDNSPRRAIFVSGAPADILPEIHERLRNAGLNPSGNPEVNPETGWTGENFTVTINLFTARDMARLSGSYEGCEPDEAGVLIGIGQYLRTTHTVTP